MDWYAIQVMTGKETQVVADLKDHGKEVMQPKRPLFYRRGGNLRIVQNPLFPGYVFARLEVTDFYKEKRDLRVEGMMIRLCVNNYEAVELSSDEIDGIIDKQDSLPGGLSQDLSPSCGPGCGISCSCRKIRR
jgi:transcription antitermination factor NusG